MTRFGAHAFIWAGDWTPASAERVVRGAAEAGLDFVEVPILHPEDFDVANTRALLEEHGLAATGSLGLPRDAHLPFAPERARAFLESALRVVEGIGATALSGAVYTHLGTLTGAPPREDELESVVRVLRDVARTAGAAGLGLGVEAINRYENYLINLASQATAVVERINEPNVFVHLDTYHMNIEEKGFFDPIVATGRHLRYIHLSESDRGTPGSGNVRWDDVFRGLAAIGFDGDLVMESFAAINPDIIGATALWRDVVGDPVALVRDGLAFLRGKSERFGLGA